MKKIIIALILVVTISDLSWGKWIEFDKDEVLQFFYDESKISIIDENKLSVNILINHSNNEDYKSSIIVNVVNCKKRFYKVQTSHLYSEPMGKGSREFSKNIGIYYNLEGYTGWIDSTNLDDPDDPVFLDFFNKICKAYLPKVNINTNITANEYLSHLMVKNDYKFNCEILPRKMDPEYKYLSKKIKKDYNKSVDAFNKREFKKAINLLNNLLSNPNLKAFDKAMIFKLLGYIYSNQGDQKKSFYYVTKALCLNSLNINDQFSTHRDLVTFFISNNYSMNALNELLKMKDYFTKIYNIEKKSPGFLGVVDLPKNNWIIEIDSMLSEFYLFHAKNSPKQSKAEKEFYKKSLQYIENTISSSFSPPHFWYLIYLDNLIYEENYDKAFEILEKVINYLYFYQKDFKQNLLNKYTKLKIKDEKRFQTALDNIDINSFINQTLETEIKVAKYPAYARQQSIDGWSLIEYEINSEGKVINPVAIDFSNEIFNKNSIKSISQTIFNIRNINAEDLPLKNQRTIFIFQIKECPWPTIKNPIYEVSAWKSCMRKSKG